MEGGNLLAQKTMLCYVRDLNSLLSIFRSLGL